MKIIKGLEIKNNINKLQAVPVVRNLLSGLMIGLTALKHLNIFDKEQLPKLLQAVSDLNHRLIALENDQDNLAKSMPVALRKITRDIAEIHEKMDQRFSETYRNLDNLPHFTGYLPGREEFVRRELMFAMRSGASEPSDGGHRLSRKIEILSPEKLAAARKECVRLNLGCGHVPLEGYLNVDRRALPGVDIVAEAHELPFEKGEVDEIFSAHFLELFPQEQLRRELLPYYSNLLKAGGKFQAIVPDAEAMINSYAAGGYPYSSLREVMFGTQDYDGDFHFNMFTPESLSELLKECGFVEVEILTSGRKSGACFEFEITGSKP